MSNPAVVVLPTYNERDNLDWIVGRVLASGARADVLVVDDGSPDGTGALADAYAARDDRVHVLHRTEKAGLGAAYLGGRSIASQAAAGVVTELRPGAVQVLSRAMRADTEPVGAIGF